MTDNARAGLGRACETLTTTHSTIAEIEQPINFWCAREAPGTDGALYSRKRPLRDVYGLMIYVRALSADMSRLTPEQLDSIHVALYQREPPR